MICRHGQGHQEGEKFAAHALIDRDALIKRVQYLPVLSLYRRGQCIYLVLSLICVFFEDRRNFVAVGLKRPRVIFLNHGEVFTGVEFHRLKRRRIVEKSQKNLSLVVRRKLPPLLFNLQILREEVPRDSVRERRLAALGQRRLLVNLFLVQSVIRSRFQRVPSGCDLYAVGRAVAVRVGIVALCLPQLLLPVLEPVAVLVPFKNGVDLLYTLGRERAIDGFPLFDAGAEEDADSYDAECEEDEKKAKRRHDRCIMQYEV